MKLKRTRFNPFFFPSFIMFAAVGPLLIAAPITPDPAGNITVPTGTNAASTIVASGGTSPAPIITVQSGASLSGDPAFLTAAQIIASGYTFNNSGSLSAVNEGIFVQSAAAGVFTLNNLAGGSIQGGTDAVYLNADGGIINNSGTIFGTGSGSDGIEGFNNLRVTNNNLISGASGIVGANTLNVLNNSSGIITGTADAGIYAFDDVNIENFGLIQSTVSDGIVLFDNGTVFNTNGRIEGATNGLFTGIGLSVVNESGGTINGISGVGIDAGSGAEIFNDAGATISGGNGGVTLGANGYVENDGIISGNNGDGINLGTSGEVFNTGLIQGTTGIVANNGSTITNTGIIQSTAIGGNAFSGGAGNDNFFLNAGSRIEGNVLGGGGTNSITFNGGLTSPTSAVNNISGSVTNFATITKNGTGVALIGDVSDVGNGLTISADTINITSGGLYFNGNITGASTALATINAGGAATGGTGLWNANLNVTAGGVSAGAIPINLDSNPANAVGTFAITGDVVHSAGSFIRLDIVSGAPVIDGINSDIIEQIGAGNTYTLTGANLRISTTDGNKAISNGTYTIIDSDEVIVGNVGTIGIQFNPNTAASGPFFATESGANATNTVLTNYFLTTGFADGGTNLTATVQHNYAGLPGLSENESALGGALDASVGSGDARLQGLIAALDFSNLGAVQSTLATLSPEAFLDFTAGIVNSNYRLHRTLQDHLAATRSSSDLMKMSVGATMDSKGSKGGIVPNEMSPTSEGTFWGSVSYDWQDYEGDGPNSDFDGETGAITAGFDYRVAPALVLGIVLDGSTSDFDSDNSSSDIDSLRAVVYGTYGKSTGLYSDFLVGYGTHDLDFDRDLGGIISGSSSSSTDATSLQALWTVGYAFGDSRIKHGPFAGFEYQSVEVDGYRDSGVLPISVGDYDDDSFRALLGYRVNTNFGRFTPYASLTYAHEFEDDGASARARFGDAPFRIRGAERGSAVLITAGTGITLTNALQLDVGYRGEVSVEDEGIDSHGGSVGLKYRF